MKDVSIFSFTTPLSAPTPVANKTTNVVYIPDHGYQLLINGRWFLSQDGLNWTMGTPFGMGTSVTGYKELFYVENINSVAVVNRGVNSRLYYSISENPYNSTSVTSFAIASSDRFFTMSGGLYRIANSKLYSGMGNLEEGLCYAEYIAEYQGKYYASGSADPTLVRCGEDSYPLGTFYAPDHTLANSTKLPYKVIQLITTESGIVAVTEQVKSTSPLYELILHFYLLNDYNQPPQLLGSKSIKSTDSRRPVSNSSDFIAYHAGVYVITAYTNAADSSGNAFSYMLPFWVSSDLVNWFEVPVSYAGIASFPYYIPIGYGGDRFFVTGVSGGPLPQFLVSNDVNAFPESVKRLLSRVAGFLGGG